MRKKQVTSLPEFLPGYTIYHKGMKNNANIPKKTYVYKDWVRKANKTLGIPAGGKQTRCWQKGRMDWRYSIWTRLLGKNLDPRRWRIARKGIAKVSTTGKCQILPPLGTAVQLPLADDELTAVPVGMRRAIADVQSAILSSMPLSLPSFQMVELLSALSYRGNESPTPSPGKEQGAQKGLRREVSLRCLSLW